MLARDRNRSKSYTTKHWNLHTPVSRRLFTLGFITANLNIGVFVEEPGWVINLQKSELVATQHLEFLGYRFDLGRGEASPTEIPKTHWKYPQSLDIQIPCSKILKSHLIW